MTDTNETSKEMSREEMDAFLREDASRQKRIADRAVEALKSCEPMLAQMTSTQRYRAEFVVRETLTTVDYLANKPVKVSVKLEVAREGRKHSPNKTFWITVEAEQEATPERPNAALFNKAHSFVHIGRRGALGGDLTDYAPFSKSRRFVGRRLVYGKK